MDQSKDIKTKKIEILLKRILILVDMGQKQDELLKRIQKLVKQNQDLIDMNEKLQKAVTELSEQNEMMKLRLKESKVELKGWRRAGRGGADEEV